MLERALHQVMSITRSPGGWICMLGEDSWCQISVTAWEGVSRPDIGPYNCCLCRVCLEARRARRPVVVERFPGNCPLRTVGDGDGCPVTSHVAVPLLIKEQVVGLLNLVAEEGRRFEAKDLDLLEGVGRQLGVAVENAYLREEIHRKEALRRELVRKIITAQEEERKRIARELHDETGQALASLLAGLNLLEKASGPDEIRAMTSDMRRVVGQTLEELHNLAWELRPSVLDDLGLVPALARYVDSCPTRFGFQADFVTVGLESQRLPREVETTLYRIAQEALTNVARHSGATHADVLLERRRGSMVLLIEDNGRGFDVGQVMASARERGHLGVYGMEERASLVGGRLTVESAPGVGTTISVGIPLEAAWLAREKRSSKDVLPSGS